MIDISRFDYIWTKDRKEYVVVKTKHGFSIMTRDSHALLIEDETVESAVIKKMLEEEMPIAVIRDGKLVDEKTGQPM